MAHAWEIPVKPKIINNSRTVRDRQTVSLLLENTLSFVTMTTVKLKLSWNRGYRRWVITCLLPGSGNTSRDPKKHKMCNISNACKY